MPYCKLVRVSGFSSQPPPYAWCVAVPRVVEEVIADGLPCTVEKVIYTDLTAPGVDTADNPLVTLEVGVGIRPIEDLATLDEKAHSNLKK